MTGERRSPYIWQTAEKSRTIPAHPSSETGSEGRPVPITASGPMPINGAVNYGPIAERVSLDTVIGNSPSQGGPKEKRTLGDWLRADNRTAQHRARQLALQLIEQQANELKVAGSVNYGPVEEQTPGTPRSSDDGEVERVAMALDLTLSLNPNAKVHDLARAAIAAQVTK